MGSVRILPEDLANQIAAGEVVERPASVVKELVENALDADAGRIDVVLDLGGLQRIEVADDGCGMSRADAELAFARHATSKIGSLADLARVATLGFRGEALPSIASVARVRMRTRRAADPLGVELTGEGRGIANVREIACTPGTRVEVAELFEQVPARRKFLRSATTEATHALRWLERIALARPDVRFALERDGRSSLCLLPTGDVLERVRAVLPPALGERLIPVEAHGERARVRGFATPTDVARGTASDLHVYVNARPVRDRLLLGAVREAYRDALPPGRHPAVVLYVEIEPDDVDVNVHPAKWEVRFREPESVRRLVRAALVRALGVHAPRGAAYADAPATRPGFAFDRDLERAGGEAASGTGAGDWLFARDLARDLAREHGGTGAPVAFRALRYVGQVLGTFLVLEGESELVLLDQHAAHERVIFERLREAAAADKLERQALLGVERIELSRRAAEVLLARREELGRAGFELEIGAAGASGGVRVVLREVPALVAGRRGLDWQLLLEETAAQLGEPEAASSRDGLEGALHRTLATAACHAACRSGDRLDAQEVGALLAALDATVWFPNCPHGRPILARFERGELERRFLRRT